MSSKPLEGMTAVLTGACGDIGSAIAGKLHADGAHLVLWDLNAEGLEALNAKLSGDHHTGVVDITDLTAVASAAEVVLSQCGGADVLINSAGILPPHEPTWELTAERLQQTLNVNLMGAFHCMRSFIPQLKARQKQHGRARIINMASYLGLEPQGGDGAYAASKAGLVALSKSLSRELAAEGILVNCVAPTAVQSAMAEALPAEVLAGKISNIPLGRLALPQDVAEMVAWLCSPACSFATGAVFDVTGGRSNH